MIIHARNAWCNALSAPQHNHDQIVDVGAHLGISMIARPVTHNESLI